MKDVLHALVLEPGYDNSGYLLAALLSHHWRLVLRLLPQLGHLQKGAQRFPVNLRGEIEAHVAILAGQDAPGEAYARPLPDETCVGIDHRHRGLHSMECFPYRNVYVLPPAGLIAIIEG